MNYFQNCINNKMKLEFCCLVMALVFRGTSCSQDIEQNSQDIEQNSQDIEQNSQDIEQNSKSGLYISTFNIQVLGKTKVQKSDVVDVLCEVRGLLSLQR